jgi:hypothetical protein
MSATVYRLPIFAFREAADCDRLFCDGLVHCSHGGEAVPIYLDVLVLLNFLVDLLLIMGTNRLAGHPLAMKRALLAAALGGLYGGICVLPGLTFLGAVWWRILSLVGMAGIAFGFRKSAIPRGVLFVLLSMALGGVAVALGRGDFLSLVLSAVLIAGCVFWAFGGKSGRNMWMWSWMGFA